VKKNYLTEKRLFYLLYSRRNYKELIMQVTMTEFKRNLEMYIKLIGMQEIIITKNGQQIAKIEGPKIDKVRAMKSTFGVIPSDSDLDEAKAARLL
jgi:hypothetical protein